MKARIFTILCLAYTSIYAQMPTNGLVAYFPFFGNAKDSSVNKTHGTVSNATLTSDRYGNMHGAYQFSGMSNSYINFSSANVQNNRYTYSLWAKINQAPSSGDMAFALNIGGAGGDQSLNIANNYAGVYNGWLGGGYNTVAPNFGMQEGASLSTTKWTHVVCVRDSTYSILYIDGIKVDSMGSSTVKYPSYGSGAVGAYIGMRNNGSGPFNGKIDDVCIYNRALNKSEVLALFQDQSTTSLETVTTSDFNFNLYPNPSQNFFIIELDEFKETVNNYEVFVTSVLGQNMAIELTNIDESTTSVSHQLPSGIYNVNIKNLATGFIRSKKVIIQ